MKKKKGLFKILNPKNLEKEVHMYGYNFSFRSHLLILITTLAGMTALGIIFRLNVVPIMLIMAAAAAVLPYLILNVYKRMYEQKRYSDVLTYIEQLMYSFQKTEKILDSLRECDEAFADGEMKNAIREAIAYIEAGKSRTDKGILREALEIIEKPYANKKIHAAHELLLNAEEEGGETRNSILILLEDTEVWKRRVYGMQADKKQSHTDNTLSIIVATLLCAAALYAIDYMRVMFNADNVSDVFKNPVIQGTSTLFIIFSIFVYAKSLKSLTNDWIKDDSSKDEDIRKSYHEAANYDETKEKRHSIIWAAPFFVQALPAYIWISPWLCVGLLAVGAFMLEQHRIGHNILMNDVKNALYVALPEWLMSMALLLQNNNVQVSITKSRETAPAVLQEELKQLEARLKTSPRELATYTQFCERFNIPEAASCMKMLYSISEAGTGDAETQITNLLGHISKMQDKADQITDENVTFKMKMIFMYPIFATSVKMLIDMTIGMFVVMQVMGTAV